MKTHDGRPRKWAQVKVDGHRLEVLRDETGRVRCFTRTPTEIDLSWHPLAGAAWSRLPLGTTLVGELWIPGKHASQVKTAIGARDPALTFSPFSVSSAPAELSLQHIEERLRLWGFSDLLPYWEPRDTLLEDWMTAKAACEWAEGIVYKSGNWLDEAKWKPVLTADLVVRRVNDAKGMKYLGLPGSLECGLFLGEAIADVGGLTMQQRLEFSDDPPVGKVVEVKYDRVDSGGRLRFPRFVRLRDDKSPEECTEL